MIFLRATAEHDPTVQEHIVGLAGTGVETDKDIARVEVTCMYVYNIHSQYNN